MEFNEAIWIKSYIFFTALDPGLLLTVERHIILTLPPSEYLLLVIHLFPPTQAPPPEIFSDHWV